MPHAPKSRAGPSSKLVRARAKAKRAPPASSAQKAQADAAAEALAADDSSTDEYQQHARGRRASLPTPRVIEEDRKRPLVKEEALSADDSTAPSTAKRARRHRSVAPASVPVPLSPIAFVASTPDGESEVVGDDGRESSVAVAAATAASREGSVQAQQTPPGDSHDMIPRAEAVSIAQPGRRRPQKKSKPEMVVGGAPRVDSIVRPSPPVAMQPISRISPISTMLPTALHVCLTVFPHFDQESDVFKAMEQALVKSLMFTPSHLEQTQIELVVEHLGLKTWDLDKIKLQQLTDAIRTRWQTCMTDHLEQTAAGVLTKYEQDHLHARKAAFRKVHKKPWNLFCYHVDQARLHIAGRGRHLTDEASVAKDHASIKADLWDTMPSAEQDEWVALHDVLSSGNMDALQPACGRDLLIRQGRIGSVLTEGSE